MRRLTLRQILDVTETPTPTFKALRLRKQLALAFGRSDAYESLSYVELDAVALLLTDTLAKSFNRTFAAQLVRVYWDVWGAVVARAEADASTPAHFVVVDFRTRDGKEAHMVCGAQGPTDDEAIAAQLAMTPQAEGATPTRVTKVNVVPLIRFIRESAAKRDLDLLASSFLPLPDDPRLAELLAPWTEARDRAVDMLKAIRAKDQDEARRAGALARSALEAYMPKPEGTALQ